MSNGMYFVYILYVEGEQKNSTQTFLSLEAISYRPDGGFKALKAVVYY